MSISPQTPCLEVRDLCVADVVKDVNFSIAPGEKLGLIGESGSGKTLTSLAIMRLVDSTGTITLQEEDLSECDEKTLCTIRGKRMAMVFQEPMTALDPLMAVGKQIGLAISMHEKLPRQEKQTKIAQLLTEVELDPALAKRYPHELSGGQRQRVMIAMALAHDPALLICDEPTTALDVTSQKAIVDLILRLVDERGMSLLFITHDLALVSQVCDRVIVLKQGEIVEEGSTERVLHDPQTAYTQQLLAASQLSPARVSVVATDPIIVVDHVTKKFKKHLAVDDLSLTVNKGERLGIVGGSGSGKTTLLKMIAGLIKPTSGHIEVMGSADMVFQDPMGSLDPRMRIGTVAAEPLAHYDGAKVVEALEQVDIDPAVIGRYPHEFSGGQRQRISIARALISSPDILLADEPVSALDVSVRKTVLDLIDSLVSERDLTLVFVSHNIAVVRSLCTRVAVMDEGKIVEVGDTEEVFSNPQHSYTQSLIASVPRLEFA